MIRYGIKLDKNSYSKAEVEELLQKVVEGTLKEDIIKLKYERKSNS